MTSQNARTGAIRNYDNSLATKATWNFSEINLTEKEVDLYSNFKLHIELAIFFFQNQLLDEIIATDFSVKFQ